MSSREKFESWYLDNWGHTEDHRETLFERDPDSHEEYYRLGVRMAHEAWQAGSGATEAKCAALAAENAGLAAEVQSVKAMNDCLSEELRGYESDGAFEGPKMHLLWWKVQTPATDAFQAESRAQGVDAAIEHLTKKFEGTGHIGVPVMALEWLAQELRKGVQS